MSNFSQFFLPSGCFIRAGSVCPHHDFLVRCVRPILKELEGGQEITGNAKAINRVTCYRSRETHMGRISSLQRRMGKNNERKLWQDFNLYSFCLSLTAIAIQFCIQIDANESLPWHNRYFRIMYYLCKKYKCAICWAWIAGLYSRPDTKAGPVVLRCPRNSGKAMR